MLLGPGFVRGLLLGLPGMIEPGVALEHEVFSLIRIIACGGEVVDAFLRAEGINELADQVP